MNPPLPHDHITPFAQSQKGKKEQVTDMFDGIAGRYDFLNRALSAGTDIGWRKKAVRSLAGLHPQRILDIATGTGDMAILATRLLQPQQVIGLDISEQMLAEGRKKVEKEGFGDKIHLQQGDSETINFEANTFDAVMAAFGVRNFENLEKGLSEMLRVLKPGGQLVILEFSKPRHKMVRAFYNFYMGIVAPQVVRLLKQNKEAYQYLTDSANAFPERQRFAAILNRLGYQHTRYKSLSLGICCIYTGRKKEE